MVFWDLTTDETEMEDVCKCVSRTRVRVCMRECGWVGGYMFMNEPLRA